MIGRAESIREAKRLLVEEGYMIEGIWHISDVQDNYNATDLEAMQVLESALNNEWTSEQIFLSIDGEAEAMNLTKKDDTDRD